MTIAFILLLLAVIVFGLASVNVGVSPRFNLVALGLFFLAVSALLGSGTLISTH